MSTKTEWADKPKTLKANVNLSTGRVANVTIKFGLDTIDAKVRVLGEGRPAYHSMRWNNESVRTGTRLVKGKNGKPMTVPVKVRSTFIEVNVNGKTITARSCCKPPDNFDTKTGIYFAVRHLFRVDSLQSRPTLTRANRKTLMRALCPWLFNKPKVKHLNLA